MADMTIPNIILEQLGGNRFITMTGANHLAGDSNSLSMRLPKNASKANMLKVTLEPDDTYSMLFTYYKSPRISTKTGAYIPEKYEIIYKQSGVYCDMLQGVFTEVTHMYTRLF